MRTALPVSLIALLLASGPVPAAPASFMAGKTKLLCGTDGPQAATWSGACKDGFADGVGIATWTDGTTPNRLEGTLVQGDVGGDATLVYGETTYLGTFRHFVPHGQGFFKYRDGSMYEGGMVDGKRSGPGIYVSADRSRYEGEWLAGRREGQGQATFATGGSYEGRWHNDLFYGAGSIVYIGGRRWSGQFKEGRVASAPPLATLEEQTFRINKATTNLGTHIPGNLATSTVSGLRWSELSEGERRSVRADYPALEEGDEPPYPINGMRPVYALIAKAGYIDHHFAGTVRILVRVGADGKPLSAATIGKLAPELSRYMAGVMMLTTYKPAVCQGKPCEMQLPMVFYFETPM